MQTAELLCSSPHACRAPLLARASCLGTEPWMGNQMWNVPKQVWNVLLLQPWGFPPARFSSRASLAKHLMNTAPFTWRWTCLVLLRRCLCLSWGWGCWILIITSITHHPCNLRLETVWKVQLRIDTVVALLVGAVWLHRAQIGHVAIICLSPPHSCFLWSLKHYFHPAFLGQQDWLESSLVFSNTHVYMWASNKNFFGRWKNLLTYSKKDAKKRCCWNLLTWGTKLNFETGVGETT